MSSPLPDRSLLPLTRKYQGLLQLANDKAAPFIDRAWDNVKSYNDADIAQFHRDLKPILGSIKKTSMNLTTSYMNEVTGNRLPALGADLLDVEFAARDPFIAVWNALGQGRPFEEAVEEGRRRAHAEARNHMTSIARRTGDVYTEQAGMKVAYWRRVPDAGACPWCNLVAGNRYRSSATADFGHRRCGCTVLPVTKDADPAQVVEEASEQEVATGRRPAAPVLSDKQWAALNPRGGWDFVKQKKAIEALRETAEGRQLLDTMTGFQSGASRGIPLLRTNIEKYLTGQPVQPGMAARIENLLDAIRTNPIPKPDKLFRGMRLEGSADDVVARYSGKSTVDMNLSSFSSDKNLAKDFTVKGAGQKGPKSKNQTGVLIELDGSGAHALPIEKISKSRVFANEKEWVGGGRYEVSSVTKQKDGSVLLKIRQLAALGD